jgi:hypothetical protein
MSKSSERNKMPSRMAIAEYWSGRISEFGIFQIDQDELPDKECWACGKAHVQRCHIDDYAHGGKNAVENLVLLCPGCHAESESLSPASFWPWVRNSRQTKWKSLWDHIADKMIAAGYTPEVAAQMFAEQGFQTTVNVIAQDVYHRQSIDKTLEKHGLMLKDGKFKGAE